MGCIEHNNNPARMQSYTVITNCGLVAVGYDQNATTTIVSGLAIIATYMYVCTVCSYYLAFVNGKLTLSIHLYICTHVILNIHMYVHVCTCIYIYMYF